MLILFDNNVDWRFSKLLTGHDVKATYTMGWAEFQNGKLLRAAEDSGFPVLITADKQMQHQQNMFGRTICVIVLNSVLTDFPGISPLAGKVLAELENVRPGTLIAVTPD